MVQVLRLASLSALLALENARTGMGSFTRQTFLTKGKMPTFGTYRSASFPGSTPRPRVPLVSTLSIMMAAAPWEATIFERFLHSFCNKFVL